MRDQPASGHAPGGRSALISTDFAAAERHNRRNTVVLIIAVLATGVAVGWLAGWLLEMTATDQIPPLLSPSGIIGALICVAFGGVWTLVTLFASRPLLLSLTGAVTADATREPLLHNVVEEMAIAAGAPKPQVAVIESPALNAFTTGMRADRAAVVVTSGLLNALTRDELQGVVAHEMSHIRNLDTRYLTAVAIMVGLVALVADFAVRVLFRGSLLRGRSGSKRGGGNPLVIVLLAVGLVFLVLAPIFAKIVQMAVSRQREFLADATAIRLTRNPLGLIAALEKLHFSPIKLESANRAVQHMFIVNPLREFDDQSSALMATHPSIEQRVERLRNLGGVAAAAPAMSAASRAGAT